MHPTQDFMCGSKPCVDTELAGGRLAASDLVAHGSQRELVNQLAVLICRCQLQFCLHPRPPCIDTGAPLQHFSTQQGHTEHQFVGHAECRHATGRCNLIQCCSVPTTAAVVLAHRALQYVASVHMCIFIMLMHTSPRKSLAATSL